MARFYVQTGIMPYCNFLKGYMLIAPFCFMIAACTKEPPVPGSPLPLTPGNDTCVANSSDAYWRDIEGVYPNKVCFLIDHDLLWCDYAKLDILIDSIDLADGISVDRPSLHATFTDLTSGEILLFEDSIYSKHINANRLIHNLHQQYSSGLLTEKDNNIADLKLEFADAYGNAVVSAEHPDNIVTMNFEHLEYGIVY